MPFDFIPRSIGKQKKQSPLIRRGDSNPKAACVIESALPAANSPTKNFAVVAKPERMPNDEELLVLIGLSLSDYAFWSSPDLYHILRTGNEGYIPLRHLLSTSPAFSSLEQKPSETDLTRCARSSPVSHLDVRMLISEPSGNAWFDRGPRGSSSTQYQSGGFEIRRKDWENVLTTLADGSWTKARWDQCTMYLERLPAPYRSIHSIARYVQTLSSSQGDEESSTTLVQSVTFPPHHLASPNEVPGCKGFAFVILDSPAIIDKLSRSYPWEGSAAHGINPESHRFGLRVLPKASWDKLKLEYLARQQSLLSQVAGEAAASEAQAMTECHDDTPELENRYSSMDGKALPTVTKSQHHPDWYPRDCLIFVRKIHPDTNKTTLRTLFSSVFSSSGGIVDYVDFSKGVDSCHLRIASPSAAAELVSHFVSHSIAQKDGLDQVGSAPTTERPKIELELIQGKREELYWKKVPEKVRRVAVERLKTTENGERVEKHATSGQRKRRKHG